MKKPSSGPPVCPNCGASLPHNHPTAVERCAAIQREQRIQSLIREFGISSKEATEIEAGMRPYPKE